MASLGLLSSTSTPNPDTTDAFKKQWGADAILVQNGRDGAFVYLPSQDISVPINPDGSQDLGRSTDTNGFNNFMMQILPIAAMSFASAGVLGAAGAAGATEGAATGTAAGSTGAAAGSTAGLTQAELAALIESGTVGTAGAGLEAAAGIGGSAAAGGAAAALEAGQAQPPVDAGVGGSPNAPGSFATDPITGDVTSLGTQPGAVGTVGGGGVTTAANTLAGGSALSRILAGNGSATDADWLQILGTGAATGLGLYGANQQAGALNDLADKYMAIGAPSRARYEATFAPDFKPQDIPGYQGAIDTSMQSLLRQISAKDGNPWGSPGGTTEALKYVTGNVGLPAIQQYRNQLAATGGYGAFNSAAPGAATGAVGAQGNVYNVLGAGIADLTQPRQRYSLSDMYRSLA